MNVLALHGYHMSGKIMCSMSMPLLKRLDYNINLITPDAPCLIKKPLSPEITKYFKPPYYQWFNEVNNINIDTLKKLDNIDGIIGFSQGAHIASIIAPYIKPKFIVCIAGVDYDINNNIIDIPSFHIIGVNDHLFSKSINLTKKFKNPDIVYHLGGHHFPKDLNIYKDVNKFINKIVTPTYVSN